VILLTITLPECQQFFDSLDSGDLPYKTVENLKFELYARLWKPTCITAPNLIKISQKVAEIR